MRVCTIGCYLRQRWLSWPEQIYPCVPALGNTLSLWDGDLQWIEAEYRRGRAGRENVMALREKSSSGESDAGGRLLYSEFPPQSCRKRVCDGMCGGDM